MSQRAIDTRASTSFGGLESLACAGIVLPERIVSGRIGVEAGMITEVHADAEGGAPAPDGGTDFLVPGAVDLHTDHAEKHVFPRASVVWHPVTALLAHDAQMIASGTTTVFDSLCVGTSLRRPERREILAPLLDGLEQAAGHGMLRAEHLVHLRCEICDPDTPGLVEANIDRPLVALASVMDHTPGDRQSPDVERWIRHMASSLGLDLEEARHQTRELLVRSADVGAGVRARVIDAVAARGLPLMSHDDARPEHVAQAADEGVSISEFPTTVAAAEAARAHGLTVVAGAPNYLRGGSQSGNVGVAELLAAGLVDILASDYIPRSPLDAAFAIAEDAAQPAALPQAIAMVTVQAARAAGLRDRGAIAPGQRADLVLLRRVDGVNHIRAVWRAGERVL